MGDLDGPIILTMERFAELLENNRVVGIECIGYDKSVRALVLRLRGGANENDKLRLTILATLDVGDDARLEFFEGRVAQWGDVELGP